MGRSAGDSYTFVEDSLLISLTCDFVYVCMYVYILIQVHVCQCVCVCAHTPEVRGLSQSFPLLILLRQSLSVNLNSLVQLQ